MLLSEIRAHGESRPPGYVNDLLANGVVDKWWLRIPLSALLAVKEKHGVPDFSVPPDPLSESLWPAHIAAIAAQRRPGEVGAGDTVARVIGAFGSAEWRSWYAANAGIFAPQCQCTGWQKRWNVMYPYRMGLPGESDGLPNPGPVAGVLPIDFGGDVGENAEMLTR